MENYYYCTWSGYGQLLLLHMERSWTIITIAHGAVMDNYYCCTWSGYTCTNGTKMDETKNSLLLSWR